MINERELPNWKRGPTQSEFLNQLGAEGWEAYAASAGYGDLYYFKRPKPTA
jgi:hypothetical protein